MPTVENTSTETRTWPDLQTVAGVTLELEPSESTEVLELPKGFEDPYLEIVKQPASTPAVPATTPATTQPSAAKKEPSA